MYLADKVYKGRTAFRESISQETRSYWGLGQVGGGDGGFYAGLVRNLCIVAARM